MNKKTKKTALEAAIQHWRENELAETSSGASVWGGDCALCELFSHRRSSSRCEGCPVSKRTGKPGCEGSPWEIASRAFVKWRIKENFGETALEISSARDDFRAAARVEREFLESLLVDSEDQKESGRILPPTKLRIPMPPVKPPPSA